jgi:hypothetical protein
VRRFHEARGTGCAYDWYTRFGPSLRAWARLAWMAAIMVVCLLACLLAEIARVAFASNRWCDL